MTNTLRKTKIICTLGPASETPERLREMILAGTNIFRLNMSHAKHDWVREIVPTIRSIAAGLDIPVGILLDTQGPAVRTGDLSTKLDLKVGDIMVFTVRGARSEELYSVNVNYDGLIDDINEGDVVVIDGVDKLTNGAKVILATGDDNKKQGGASADATPAPGS